MMSSGAEGRVPVFEYRFQALGLHVGDYLLDGTGIGYGKLSKVAFVFQPFIFFIAAGRDLGTGADVAGTGFYDPGPEVVGFAGGNKQISFVEEQPERQHHLFQIQL